MTRYFQRTRHGRNVTQLQTSLQKKVEVYVPIRSRKSDTPKPLWITNKVIKTAKDKFNKWKKYIGEKTTETYRQYKKKRRTWLLRLSELLNVGLRKI